MRGQLVAVMLAASAWWAAGAAAQGYPSKPIRVVVPSGPAGTLDILGRLIAQRLGDSWKQGAVVDNRAGASGIIGSQFLAQAAPDGHTILVGTSTTHGTNPAAYSKLPYDAVRDFAPIANLAETTFLLSVHPSVGVSNLTEFIAAARAKPGGLTYASFGQGGIAHFVTESFALGAGVKMLHVPYKSAPDAAKALIAGEVNASFDALAVMLPHIKAGRVRPLAIGSSRRVAALPELPTFGEAGGPGLAGYTSYVWYGVFAPAGTPGDIVAKLNGELLAMLAVAETRARLEGLGLAIIGSSPKELADLVRADIDRYQRVAREANIKAD